MQFITNSYILTEVEYKKLTNPDKCYTPLTKTNAESTINNVLKYLPIVIIINVVLNVLYLKY
jgi:hypothetical protein